MKSLQKFKTQYVKCPHCGWEFHPAHVFYPGSFLGKPGQLVRDALVKVIYEEYDDVDDEPCFVEHFECEECGKQFVVEATVSYKTREEEEELNFQQEYVSLLD